MKKLFLLSAVLALPFNACTQSEAPTEEIVEAVVAETTETVETEVVESVDLDAILDAQPEEVKARYAFRNPGATIKYLGIEPGMTVAEVLPGGGWYSKILLEYLGEEGTLVGIDYDVRMWAKFGGFATEKFLNDRKTWADQWSKGAVEWSGETGAQVSAYPFGSVPEGAENSVDAIILVRALHHLNRFERAHLADSLSDMTTILKPDGIVGIVQHRAAEDQDDDWANGDNGYMKQSYVIQIMDEAGFELAEDPSEINANPKDKATSANGDQVWRLPPTLGTSGEDAELRAAMEAIGETDRMTLKFKLKD